MEFRVLGPVRVLRDGDEVPLSGTLARTLLATLLSRPGRPVSVDALVEAMWPGRPDGAAARKLQVHASRLRAALGDADRVTFAQGAYQLTVLPGELDAVRFDDLVTEAGKVAAADLARCAELLRTALALWRGDPFADLDTPAIADAADRLTERRLTAAELLYDAEIRRGRPDDVLAELAVAAQANPLRERLHALLMTALHQAGRRADALEAYRTVRHNLVEQLGLEPGPQLHQLHQQILTGRPAAGDLAVPVQLPHQVRSFVGRDAELADLDHLIDQPNQQADTPLVIMVTGTAGVGKTALALRWAHRVQHRFPGGRLYVDLHGYDPEEPRTPHDALAGFLRAFGLSGAAIPQDTAERAARYRTLCDQRRMLVVLDNAHAADQVRPLLPGNSACVVLVTSRDALAGLAARDGAIRVALDQLSPGEAADLLAFLLGDRAAAEPDAVTELIDRCARLPLALRIAAELIRTLPGMTVADLVTELTDEHERLDVLDIDGDPHSALRAVFSWSYQHLPAEAARLFRLFGRHPGHDLDIHALAALAGAPLREVRRAAGVLLRANLADETRDGRLHLHDLLRAYATELIRTIDGEQACDAATTRLTDHFLHAAAEAMNRVSPTAAGLRPQPAAPAQPAPAPATFEEATGWLEAERANLIAIARWAADHDQPSTVVTLSEILWRFLDMRNYYDDSYALHSSAVQAARALRDPVAEGNALRVLGGAHLRIGQLTTARDLFGQALERYRSTGDRLRQATALNSLACAESDLGETDDATAHFHEAIDIYRAEGDHPLQANPLSNLGDHRRRLGDLDGARRYSEAGLAAADGDRVSQCRALLNIGQVLVADGRYDQAVEYAQAALAVARSSGLRIMAGEGLALLGVVRATQRDHERAYDHFREAIDVLRATGTAAGLVQVLINCAEAYRAGGDSDEAIRRHAEAVAVATNHGNRLDRIHAHTGLGDAYAELGDPDQAREQWTLALTLSRDVGARSTAIEERLAGHVTPVR